MTKTYQAETAANKCNIFKGVLLYGRMIKFSHTVFALPFALSAAVLALRQNPITMTDILFILAAMIGARCAAMGFNRIADSEFDAKNPRTARRAIPAGKLGKGHTKLFVLFFSLLFIFSSAMLGSLCLYLSVPVLILLFFYSFTKRFTWICHIYLGFSISLAPAGTWIALTNSFSWPVLLLSFSLMTYIAGFDILYACLDMEFDKQEGLFSIPVRFGIKKALFIASLLHLVSFFFFFLIYIVFDMKLIYLSSVIIIGLLFISEHILVQPDNFTKINTAFFHLNSIISIVLFIGVLADESVSRWI